jgi:hypothetical protein
LFILSAGSFSTCSQLIHTRFVAALASGLETRNQLRKRQEKNEFYFRLRPKKFLTGKMKHACRRKTKKQCVQKFRERARGIRIAATNRLRC